MAAAWQKIVFPHAKSKLVWQLRWAGSQGLGPSSPRMLLGFVSPESCSGWEEGEDEGEGAEILAICASLWGESEAPPGGKRRGLRTCLLYPALLPRMDLTLAGLGADGNFVQTEGYTGTTQVPLRSPFISCS